MMKRLQIVPYMWSSCNPRNTEKFSFFLHFALHIFFFCLAEKKSVSPSASPGECLFFLLCASRGGHSFHDRNTVFHNPCQAHKIFCASELCPRTGHSSTQLRKAAKLHLCVCVCLPIEAAGWVRMLTVFSHFSWVVIELHEQDSHWVRFSTSCKTCSCYGTSK